MNKLKLSGALLSLVVSFVITSCKPSSSIRTTVLWVNKEKLPPQPIKTVFIIAFTDDLEVRSHFENDLADAAKKKGVKAYTSMGMIGPVEMKQIAPVRDVFIKKLQDSSCEAILTVALVHETSDTKYTPASSINYSPYAYGSYSPYTGITAFDPYGGFGGYYGYAVTTMTTPGYYTTTNKYFVEAKVFDIKTDETLMTTQTKVTNPESIQKASKQYADLFMEEVKGVRKK
jgi:hypothetical protein